MSCIAGQGERASPAELEVGTLRRGSSRPAGVSDPRTAILELARNSLLRIAMASALVGATVALEHAMVSRDTANRAALSRANELAGPWTPSRSVRSSMHE